MKRREFIASVGAVAAVPMIPKAALAGTGIAPAVLARGEHLASLWVHSSATMFKNALQLDAKTATSLFDALTKQGVLGQANRFGVARVVVPYYETPAFLLRQRLAATKARIATSTSKSPNTDFAEKIETIGERILQDDPTTEITDTTEQDYDEPA